MDPVIQVINTIIENKDKISDVVRVGASYFFLYRKKYVFSITPKNEARLDQFWFTVYPSTKFSIQDIIDDMNALDNNGVEIPSVSYESENYKSQEATESFKDLLIVVQSKLYDVDEIFNDILKDSEEY